MLQKTKQEQGGKVTYPTMLMKISQLTLRTYDVYENKYT